MSTTNTTGGDLFVYCDPIPMDDLMPHRVRLAKIRRELPECRALLAMHERLDWTRRRGYYCVNRAIAYQHRLHELQVEEREIVEFIRRCGGDVV